MATRLLTLSLLVASLVGGIVGGSPRVSGTAAAEECATFAETGHRVCGRFLTYWRDHGGLAQQGLPLTEAFTEPSTIDGRTYTVQYFERAVFELHAENLASNDVLLSLLGRDALQARQATGSPVAGPALPGECAAFPTTGQTVCGAFLAYWLSNGGLPQQGYPLTGILMERSASDGQTYQVQYFERAILELHPENQPPYDVLLSQLGRARLATRYPDGPGGIDSAFLALGALTVQTVSRNYVEWSVSVRNVSNRALLSATLMVSFLDAGGQLLDQSLAGGANIAPGETRVLKGLSIKGLGYASYRAQPPQITVQPAR